MKQNIPILQNYFYLNMNISNIWENLQVQINRSIWTE